jgi:uncharacterized membrane protein YuzA (DUF378 family)
MILAVCPNKTPYGLTSFDCITIILGKKSSGYLLSNVTFLIVPLSQKVTLYDKIQLRKIVKLL